MTTEQLEFQREGITNKNSHVNLLAQVNLADKTFCLKSTQISFVCNTVLVISARFHLRALLSSAVI